MRSSVMLGALAGETPLRPGLVRFCFRHGNEAVKDEIVRQIEVGAPVVGLLSPTERLDLLLERLPATARKGDASWLSDSYRIAAWFILQNPTINTDGNLERLFGLLGDGLDDGTIPHYVADTMILEALDWDLRERIDILKISADLRDIIEVLRQQAALSRVR